MEYFKTPHIIRESSRGYDAISILDDMLSDRCINCVTEIDSESVNSMIMQMLYLEKEDPDGEITLYINSPGGSVDDGLALYDTMQAISCPVKTVCMGMAASMASVIFSSGDDRLLLPHSRIMIHDPLIKNTGGSALSLETISQNLLKTRQTMAEILSRHTNKTVEEILEKTKTDTYFMADEAIEFGLADRIITSI